MIQNIIVWMIVATAIGYTIYSLVKTINAKPESGCGGGCSSCDAKKEIMRSVKYKKMRLVVKPNK